MLQIPLTWQHPAPKCCKLHQSVANSTENERFELKNAANTVEMAASRFKMLQIEGKWTEQETPPKKPNNSRPVTLEFSFFNIEVFRFASEIPILLVGSPTSLL